MDEFAGNVYQRGSGEAMQQCIMYHGGHVTSLDLLSKGHSAFDVGICSAYQAPHVIVGSST